MEVEAIRVNYKVGDKVVYPHHGAGKVLKKEKQEMIGEVREYLTIKILHNDMTVMVPSDSAGRAGLRRVIGEPEVERVLAVLRDDMSQMPKNWNRRFKHNRDKMKTGDIFELAEVVRNLAIRDFQKGLSTGEKQMFTRAKKILASELMYALDMEEKDAEDYLDDLLEQTNTERARSSEVGSIGYRPPGGGGNRRAPWRRGTEGARRARRPAHGGLVAARARSRGEHRPGRDRSARRARGRPRGARARGRSGARRAHRAGRGEPLGLGLGALGGRPPARRWCSFTMRPDRSSPTS